MQKVNLSEMGITPITGEVLQSDAESVYLQLAEQVYDEMLDFIRSMQGWQILSGSTSLDDANGLDERFKTREYYVKRSRLLARHEPVSKQAIRLYTTYCGIHKAEFRSKDETAEKIWTTKIWNLRRNKKIFGALYRRKLATRLLTDGELFIALLPQTDGEVVVRLIDPLQFPDDAILTHPEDAETVLYYKRAVPQNNRLTSNIGNPERSYQPYLFYRDWTVTDEDLQEAVEAGFTMPPEEQIAVTPGGEDILMFHVPFDSFGNRGNGLLFAVISYVENFRNFLQDRATIVRGLSTYIRTITMNSGSRAVNKVAAMFRSGISTSEIFDRNPPDVAGSTWVQNRQIQKEETPPNTAAGNAMQDARIFRQPIASGVGITEANLIGDPSIGNLASQEQMEGPQLRNFQDFQFLVEETLKELWRFVLEYNEVPNVAEIPLDIDLPPITLTPIKDLVAALTLGVDKTLIPHEEASKQFMMSLGVADMDEAVKQATKEKEEKREQFQQNVQPSQGTPNQGPQALRERHGENVSGTCPFCSTDGLLKEDHGLHYCQSCGVTYDPSFYSEKQLAKMTETMVAFMKDRFDVELSDEDLGTIFG